MEFDHLYLLHPEGPVCWPEVFDDIQPVLPERDRGPMVNGVFLNSRTGLNYPLIGNMISDGVVYLLKGHISEIQFDLLREHGQAFARRVGFVACPCPRDQLHDCSLEQPSLELINSIQDLEDESCLTFEGLVTPGATMMIGQYRQAKEGIMEWNCTEASMDLVRGPFMFWSVRDLDCVD